MKGDLSLEWSGVGGAVMCCFKRGMKKQFLTWWCWCWCFLCAMDGLNVGSLDKVKAGQDTGAGDTAENVGAVTLEEGGDALILHDLSTGIECRFVVDA